MIKETSINFFHTKDGEKRGQLICPHCGNPTSTRVHYDTVIKNMPLICYKHCRQLSIVSYEKGIERAYPSKLRQSGAYKEID